jgi:hypothetical protein
MVKLWVWDIDGDKIVVAADTERDARVIAKCKIEKFYNARWVPEFKDEVDAIILTKDRDD